MPEGISFEVATCIGQLPHFNPDVDVESNETLAAWVQQVREADGLVISTPEYARGYPGSLKNALDWLVQTDAHIDKPFMLLKASSRSSVAHDTLTVVLQTMSGIHIEAASMTVSLLGKSLGVPEILATDDAENRIRQALELFVREIRNEASKNGSHDFA